MKYRYFIIIPIFVYVITSSILILMDYWNPQQVSHYLGLDLIYGLIPSLITMIGLMFMNPEFSNEKQNLVDKQ